MTAVALVQLADRGRLDMNADINNYLRRVRLPDADSGPITAKQLLDHTAGLDEIRPGTQASALDSVLSLDAFLGPRLVRVRPAGRTTSYSTYAITVAGLMVEEISGESVESHMSKEIWNPLGMQHTSITVPAEDAGNVAVGYARGRDSALASQAWEWYHTTPASSVNSAAADMGRFMSVLLTPGSGLVSDRGLRYMQRQHATGHPRLPGFALGVYEDFVGDLRVLEH